MDIMEFLTIIILAFAIVMVLAGIFTAYFGSGKSRSVGVVLFLVGLVVGIVWAYLTGWSTVEPFCDVALWDVFYNALINLIGVLVGALIAVAIFLVAVMKS